MAQDRDLFETKGAIGVAWIDNPVKGNALSANVLGDSVDIIILSRVIVYQCHGINIRLYSGRGVHYFAGSLLSI